MPIEAPDLGPFGGHSTPDPTATPDVAGEPFTNNAANTIVNSLVEIVAALNQVIADVESIDVPDQLQPEFRIEAGWLEWRIQDSGDAWTQLLDVSDLDGADGRDLEMRNAEGTIEWRLVGDPEWTPLVTIPSTSVDVKRSIEDDAGELQLVGDTDSPGNHRVYGTDGSGVRGWRELATVARTGQAADLTGLGTAAAADTGDFDPSGAAAQALSDANSYTDGAVAGLVDAAGAAAAAPVQVVVYDDDNSAARPAGAALVVWADWPANLSPTNALTNVDIIVGPDDD